MAMLLNFNEYYSPYENSSELRNKCRLNLFAPQNHVKVNNNNH